MATPALVSLPAAAQVVDMVQYEEELATIGSGGQEDITMDVAPNGVNTYSYTATVDSSDTAEIKVVTLTQAQIGTDNSSDLPFSSTGAATYTVNGTITNAMSPSYSDPVSNSNEYISSILGLHAAGQQANETYGYAKNTTNTTPYPGANAPDVSLTVTAGSDSPLLDYSPVLVDQAFVLVTVDDYNGGDSSTYAIGGNGALSAVSIGAPGSVQKAKDSTNQAEYYGGDGGSVTLTNDVDITVEGYAGGTTIDSSDQLTALFGNTAYIGAITAYSLGGDGQYEGGVGDNYSGPGGAGGDVTVSQSGDVDMHGISNPDGSNFLPSFGLWAVSSGGAGVTYGGEGNGDGGNAGTVSVTWTGALTTGDDVVNATGILAASVGGSADMSSSNPAPPGNGGDVTVSVSNDWTIAVDGDDGFGAIGVLAYSAGGQYQSGFAYNPTGGNVTISADSNANLTIQGNNLAMGLVGISSGNIADILPSDSGSANSGAVGYAQSVTIENDGILDVSADSDGAAFGIVALSAGGYAQTQTYTTAPSDTVVVGYSGSQTTNGGAFSGSAVTVTNTGTVTVTGPTSTAIIAMSVGGSGGLAAYLADASESIADGGFMALGSQATSSFAGGGNGGTVTVSNTGTVVSGSADWLDSQADQYNNAISFGIVAQSIGGGGGVGTSGRNVGGADDGGQGGGDGGSVSVDHGPGSVTTYGAASAAIVAQSIGGGGGAGGSRQGIGGATGGSGGNGGDGGTVTVDVAAGGGIYTVGDFSFGIVAQSIGGGGGSGGSATASTLGALDPFSMATGGSGGSGGDGDDVTVSLDQALVSSGARAIGIVAQSVGGGGGTAGQGVASSAILTAGISYAVGGSGGDGGSGGTVMVTNEASGVILTGCDPDDSFACSELTSFLSELDADSTIDEQSDTVSDWTPFGTINLQGADAIGIMAQSIGGGGGDGGSATAGSSIQTDGDTDIDFDIGIGATAGSGGAAGVGGTLTVTNDGAIVTAGDQGYGILAQSISGGGGNGGDASASSTASGSEYSFSLSVTLGGDGGSGGQDAGSVTVTNGSGSFDGSAGSILTFGQYASGILAQSIAGGGGTGGAGSSSSEASTSEADGISVALSVAVGGSGGTGNDGGTVSVTNATGAVIRTLGAGSRGVLAQSIGGGGGAAGAADASASGGTVSASAAVGGSGGAGGNGGNVTIVNDGLIYTGGILTGADGSTLTTGGDGVGILAQSIGGGGGTGGSSTAETTVNATDDSDDVNATQSASDSYSANVAVGGSGGAGGDGGTVSVTSNGQITTLGMRAHAIHGQSIGAGGGAGGSATSTADPSDDDDSDDDSDSGTGYAASVSVGGSGGGAGDGGDVDITNSGTIVTYGYGAHAINAQSIGGGGGQGADGTVSNNVDVSLGIVVDGSGGGAGGNGGTITITTTTSGSTASSPGSIATLGDDAFGIFVQNIGGGGGSGAAGCTNSSSSAAGQILDAAVSYLEDETASLCFGNTEVSGDFSDGTSITATLGGASGNTGDGGNVTIDHQTAITTFGDRAIGIVAQSIGGGGGFLISTNDQIVSSALVENTEEGGVGNLVTVTVESGATVQTFGDGAWGILAQSIGGGGGFVGDPSVGLPSTLATSELTGGTTSSAIGIESAGFDITVSGQIQTSGTAAHGIFAQAIAGGGGYATDSSGTQIIGSTVPGIDMSDVFYSVNTASTITVAEGGSVVANGPSSVGIFAQSVTSASTAPQITIEIDGTVSGGTGGVSSATGVAAGIYAQTASGGTITIGATGTLTTADGADGYAVYLPGGDTWTITNAGTLTGALMSGDPNSDDFTVTNTGTFNVGQALTGVELTNQGKLSIGGDGTLYQTTASYASTFDLTDSASNWLVDIDATADLSSDLLSFDVSNGTPSLSLGGTLTPNVVGGLLPEAYSIVNTTDGSAFASGAVTIEDGTTVTGSYLYSWALAMSSDTTSVDLTPSADFTPSGANLSDNEEQAADYLQNVWNAIADGNAPTSSTGSDETDIYALVFGGLYQVGSASDYESALDGMVNVASGSSTASAVTGAQTTLSASLSCPTFVGESALMHEQSCSWARITAARTDFTGEGSNDSTTDELSYRLGGQAEVHGDWIVGGSAAFNQRWQSASGGTYKSDGNGFDVSAAVKYNPGQLFLAVAGNVGYTWFDTTRLASLPGLGSGFVTSDSELLVAGGRIRAAYELPFDRSYLKPIADFDLVYAHAPAYAETGPTALAMEMDAMDFVTVAFSPALEAGTRFDFADGWTGRLYGSVGASLYSNDRIETSMGLTGAPAGVPDMTITTDLPQIVGTLDIGAQLYRAGSFEAKAEYGLDIGDGYLAQMGSLRVGVLF